jgi:hypothetical protein
MPFSPEYFRRKQSLPPLQRNLLFAYQTAKEVVKHPEIVEPALYKQAYGYAKAGLAMERGRALGETTVSRLLHEEKYEFAGWSRGVRRGLARQGFFKPGGEGFVQAWQKLALPERLVSALKHGPEEKAFYQSIAWTAKEYGVQGELLSKLGPRAPQMLQDIFYPPSLWEEMRRGIKMSQKAVLGFEGKITPQVIRQMPTGAKIAVGGAVALLGLYLTEPLSLFSGKDNDYNTLEGLAHRGEAARLRQLNTDFGSGYQDSETSDNVLAAGFGLAGAAILPNVGYSALRFGQFMDVRRYPRLREMRKYGRRGFKMWAPSFAEAMKGTTLLPADAIIKQFFKTLDPVGTREDIEGFKGFLYVNRSRGALRKILKTMPEAQSSAMYLSGLGGGEIGGEKYITYRYLKRRGLTAQPETLEGEFIFKDQNYKRKLESISKAWGGKKNIVVKEKSSALSKGVWIGLGAVEKEKGRMAHIKKFPEMYLFQRRLDLAEEFRVVTVGDKPIYSTYRWGTPEAKRAAKVLGKIHPSIARQIEKQHFLENIIPVTEKETLRGLERFATKVSKKLPYEIGAFDIGLTKAGEFQLIEAQRGFGTLRHPYVMEKIYQEVTGRIGPIGKGALGAMTVAGLGLGVLGYNLFSGKDNEYNTIEGLSHGGMAERKRRELTDFGSGWIRTALSKGISAATIAKKVAFSERVGVGISELAAPEFIKRATRIYETGLRTLGPKGAENAFARFIRESRRIRGDQESFHITRKYLSGGFGQTFKAEGITSGRGAIYKEPFHGGTGTIDYDAVIAGPAILETHTGSKMLELMSPGGVGGYIKEYMAQIIKSTGKISRGKITPMYEAEMQRQARKELGSVVPEVLGVTKKGFIQEFAGVPLPHIKESIPALQRIEKMWGKMLTGKGEKVRHFDPRIENIVRQGTRLRIIDWGVAARGGAFSESSKTAAEEVLSKYVTKISKRLRQIHPQGVKQAASNSKNSGVRHRNMGTKTVIT